MCLIERIVRIVDIKIGAKHQTFRENTISKGFIHSIIKLLDGS